MVCLLYLQLTLPAQVAFWTATAERQTKKMRQEFFKAIMRQNVGWFDSQGTGALTSRIAGFVFSSFLFLLDDILTTVILLCSKKESERNLELLSNSLRNFSRVLLLPFTLAGNSLLFSWQLVLWYVSLMISLQLALALGFVMRVMTSFTQKSRDAFASAGNVANEVMAGMRTIVSFNGEEKSYERFCKELAFATKAGEKVTERLSYLH